MDEVIDDLISLESGFNDGGLDCMEANIMQNNVSMHHITYCSNGYTLTLSKNAIYGMKVFFLLISATYPLLVNHIICS